MKNDKNVYDLISQALTLKNNKSLIFETIKEELDYKYYLAVKYEDKENAKSLGAKYDATNKAWYCYSKLDYSVENQSLIIDPDPKLQAYFPKKDKLELAQNSNSFSDFLKNMDAIGLDTNGISCVPAMKKRVARTSSKNDKGGEYSIFDNQGSFGAYAINYGTGEKIVWSSNQYNQSRFESLSSNEKQEYYLNKKVFSLNSDVKNNNLSLLMEKKKEIAIETFKEIVDNSNSAKGNEYTIYKEIDVSDSDLKQVGNKLIVPIKDINLQIKGIEIINPDGNKYILDNSQLRGCFFPLDEDFKTNGKENILCEGLSTAFSVKRLDETKNVIACLSANNMIAVCKEFKENNLKIDYIACDNDLMTAKKNEKIGNVGIKAGKKIKDELFNGVKLLIPDAVKGRNTDWNDYLNENGIDTAKQCFYDKIKEDEMIIKELGKENER